MSDKSWFKESLRQSGNISSQNSWQNNSKDKCEQFLSNAVNIPHQYRVVTIPDRCFNLNHSDLEEDILGEAGGGEEGGLRQSTYQP